MKFPFYKQLDAMDCGPTCLRMIAKFYGKKFFRTAVARTVVYPAYRGQYAGNQ